MKKLLGAIYFLIFCLYALFSYSLTDPNLVLTSWAPYWSFQQWMWQTFFSDSRLLTGTYTVLITSMFLVYIWLGKVPADATKKMKPFTSPLWLLLLVILPLIFSYNALSHDVFNYIFNSKMVLVYHANPHQLVALDFPADSWLRFMHNTNTPAPYGYGWTVISLIPSLLGFGKFTMTWLLFRTFSLLSMAFLLYAFFQLEKIDLHKKRLIWPGFLAIFLNPLFLIEVVSNSHNDLWMMAPALISFALLHKMKKMKWSTLIFSAAFLLFSISIKLSTLVLVPIWLAILLEVGLEKFRLPHILRLATSFVHQHYADLAVLMLFLPLLTPRSQQFNSWYLLWLIVWLPFMKWNWLQGAVLILSAGSLYRYIPWLLAGHFSDQIVFEQKLITWIPLIAYLLIIAGRSLFTRSFSHSSVE